MELVTNIHLGTAVAGKWIRKRGAKIKKQKISQKLPVFIIIFDQRLP